MYDVCILHVLVQCRMYMFNVCMCTMYVHVGHQSLTSGMQLRKNILVSGNADSNVKVCSANSEYYCMYLGPASCAALVAQLVERSV